MSYTSSEILLFIAAIGLLIKNAIDSWKLNDMARQTLQKAAVIEGHVNSKETKYVEEIVSLKKEIEILNKVIIDKEKTAALLAQSIVKSDKSIGKK